jgi:hypothetical protein
VESKSKYWTVPLNMHYDDKKRAWVCETHERAYGSITEALDAYGEEGWKLVGVVGNIVSPGPGIRYEQYRAFFKAPA